MRLSADRNDPGYRAYMALGRRRNLVRIMVDGKEIKHCITADSKRGRALVYEVDDSGSFVLNSKGTGAKRRQLRGRVDIVFAGGAPQ